MKIRVTETIVHIIDVDEDELVVGNGASPEDFDIEELAVFAEDVIRRWDEDGAGTMMYLRNLPDEKHPAIKGCELDMDTGGTEFELTGEDYFEEAQL